MGSVYQNSLRTIAALWARNCEEGLFCFPKQSPLPLHSCPYNLDGHNILHIRSGSSDPSYRGEACQRLDLDLDLDLVDLEVKGHFHIRKVRLEVRCRRK